MNTTLMIVIISAVCSIGTMVFLHVLFEDRSHIKGIKMPKNAIPSKLEERIENRKLDPTLFENLSKKFLEDAEAIRDAKNKWVDDIINKHSVLEEYGIHFEKKIYDDNVEILVSCDNSTKGFAIIPKPEYKKYDMDYQTLRKSNTNDPLSFRKYEGWNFVGHPHNNILNSDELVWILAKEYYKDIQFESK